MRRGYFTAKLVVIVIALVLTVHGSISFAKSIPTASTASTYIPHAPIVISADSGFTQSNGVTSGSGTTNDPYIIQGWEIVATSANAISVVGTTANFIIRGCSLHSGYQGILLRNVLNGIIQDTSVQNNGVGIDIDHSRFITVESANVSFNTGPTPPNFNFGVAGNYGVVVGFSSNITLSTSIVSWNTVKDEISVYSFSSSNVTITKSQISYNEFGLRVDDDRNTIITYNKIMGNIGDNVRLGCCPVLSYTTVVVGNLLESPQIWGTDVIFSGNNVISSSALAVNHSLTASGNSFSGSLFLSLRASLGVTPPDIVLRNNKFTSGGLDVSECGAGYSLRCGNIQITPDNTVYGQPITFYYNCSGLDITGINTGELIVVNCQNLRIHNLSIIYGYIGVQTVTVNNTLITGNNIVSNFAAGIVLKSSINITVASNNISNNGLGLQVGSNLPYVVLPGNSVNAMVYHNNFVYNTISTDIVFGSSGTGAVVKADSGYPRGGNFWSDYSGIDRCSGVAQDICPNPDGIGDTPYMLLPTGSSVDHYPLMSPYGPPDTSPPSWSQGKSLTASNVTYTGLTLTWTKAVDDVGVAKYRIYEGNILLATILGNTSSYKVNSLSPGTTYTFSVQAGDFADKWSTDGPMALATTASKSSWFVQYWYLLAALVVAGVGLPLFYLSRRFKLILVRKERLAARSCDQLG